MKFSDLFKVFVSEKKQGSLPAASAEEMCSFVSSSVAEKMNMAPLGPPQVPALNAPVASGALAGTGGAPVLPVAVTTPGRPRIETYTKQHSGAMSEAQLRVYWRALVFTVGTPFVVPLKRDGICSASKFGRN